MVTKAPEATVTCAAYWKSIHAI